MAALTADNVLLWIHGRRLGLVGDGVNTPFGLFADGVFYGSSRGVVLPLISATTGAAASVTLTGAAVGDKVLSVLDILTGANLSAERAYAGRKEGPINGCELPRREPSVTMRRIKASTNSAKAGYTSRGFVIFLSALSAAHCRSATNPSYRSSTGRVRDLKSLRT
jgi:hypothetical protein